MDDTHLYHQVAEAIRNDILTGRYRPGDRLPPSASCARIGTVPREPSSGPIMSWPRKDC